MSGSPQQLKHSQSMCLGEMRDRSSLYIAMGMIFLDLSTSASTLWT